VLEEEQSGGVVVLHGCVHACPLRKRILGPMARWIANMAGARFYSTHLGIREFSSLSIPSHWLVLQRSKRSRRGLQSFDGMRSE
jgi:hypothetical protein